MECICIKKENVKTIVEEWGTLQWMACGGNNSSQNMTVGRVVIKEGKANPIHNHPNCEEVLYVESGEILHTVAEEKNIKMEAGDSIVIPQGFKHQAINIGNEDAIVIVSFNHPFRETIGE